MLKTTGKQNQLVGYVLLDVEEEALMLLSFQLSYLLLNFVRLEAGLIVIVAEKNSV